MDKQRNKLVLDSGRRSNRTTGEMKTVFTLLAQSMVTLGMMCLVITAITTLVLKVHEIILFRYQDKK